MPPTPYALRPLRYLFHALLRCMMISVPRKLASVFFSALLLSACGGGGGGEVACVEDYWDGTIGVCLPEGWIVIDSTTLRQRGVPEETVVAFQSEVAISGQFPTVAITREELTSDVAPEDYSAASIRSVAVFPGYELLDTRTQRIGDASVQLHIFTAEPEEGEPRRRFYQLSTTSGRTGYTLTGTTPVAIDDAIEDQVVTIIESFTTEAPVAEES